MSIFEEKTHLAYPLRKRKRLDPFHIRDQAPPIDDKEKKTYFSAEQMIRSLKDYRLARL